MKSLADKPRLMIDLAHPQNLEAEYQEPRAAKEWLHSTELGFIASVGFSSLGVFSPSLLSREALDHSGTRNLSKR